jgi:transcriptional regulator with XRE-family HTH domain
VDQRDLARAAQVTESYISQLLTRKKAPPAPTRTDIYGKLDKVLQLPEGELERVATLQRREQVRRELGDEPAPLFEEVRALILRKCNPETETQMRAVFEKEPFGEVERVVTQRLLVVKRVAKEELDNQYWLRMVAELGGRGYEETRVIVLQFRRRHRRYLDGRLRCIYYRELQSLRDPLHFRPL